MSSLIEILHAELYPRLFENIEQALPEFGFRRIVNGYQSTTELKSTGESGKKGVVYVYDNNLSRLIDYTRSSQTIWDYVQNRDGLSNSETFKKLAELAGYPLTNDLSPDGMRAVAESNRKAQLWEDAFSFFSHCLSHPENVFAKSRGAQSIQDYLVNERQYHPSLFQSPGIKVDRTNPKMEVGYVPSVQDLIIHLVDKAGYPLGEVQGLITNPRIGDTHQLAIPYRDPSGRIKGMVFRTTSGSEPKYLYSAGLEKKSTLFNLKALLGDKDMVLVEGVLDALHASAAGLPNVVAIGGNGHHLTRDHIEMAIKYGARRITLLLDNDKIGIEGTIKALSLIQQFPRVRAYVAFVDLKYKDLDKLLTVEGGVDLAKKVITAAVDGWRYQLDLLFVKYQSIQDAQGYPLTDKQIDDSLQEVVETTAGLTPLDSDQFIQYFLNVEFSKEIGVRRETLDQLVDDLRSARETANRAKLTKDLFAEAGTLLTKGESDRAVDLLLSKSREIKETHKSDTFALLTQPVNRQEMIARLKHKPSDLKTGFTIEKEELEIPAGAVNILAAPTSHGKTTFMLNLALGIIRYQPKKAVYVLSYEEDADSVLMSALNIYLNTDLSLNNRKSIRSYYKDESNQYTRQVAIPAFEAREAQFFSDLIDSHKLNIHYVNYDSDTLCEAIRYLYKHGNAGAVLIDYMQLLHKGQLGKNKYGSRQLELQQICLDLKDVAVETGLPLVLGAQFNREVVGPAKLHYTKIREAADIEQIANLILGFWNNNMKSVASDGETREINQYDKQPNHIYVEKMKHRTGIPGLAGMLTFNGNTGVIANKPKLSSY